MEFRQEDFVYKSLYHENSYLQDVVAHFCQEEYQSTISKDLAQFSQKAVDHVLPLMWKAESNEPRLIQYDHWGQRIDKIEVDPAWDALHKVSAEEGMIEIGYKRASAQDSRLHQFLKLMIYHPSSAFYTCPLAMTDGATRVLELENGELKNKFFHHFLTRDPEEFWTAGQWMTEKAGGSDVAQSETYAELRDGQYFLYGTKWFTSAITANIAMTLAQTEVNGKKRLSMFLVEIRDSQGKLKNIEVLRLKDKLGTKAMPTAELRLKGTPGFLIGELGHGVKNISTVLNISRLYNSVCATGTMLRLHSLVRDYSRKREAFGKNLMDHVLHRKMLVATQADTMGCVQFCAEMGRLLGLSETNKSSSEELDLLRLFTPIAKLWTAKKSVSTVSELVEAFGGAGYIEDTQIPRFLRDAQVFAIWEGTTNIMSLDTLRAIVKNDSLTGAMTLLLQRLGKIEDCEAKKKLEGHFSETLAWLKNHQADPHKVEAGARDFSFALGDGLVGILLLEFAGSTKKKRDQWIADSFIGAVRTPLFQQGPCDDSSFDQTLFS